MRAARLLGAGAGPPATIPITPADPAPLSRRQLLTGLAILGAGAAAGGAVATVATGLSAEQVSPEIAPPVTNAAPVLTELRSPALHLQAGGQEPGKLPPLDAPFGARGTVTDAAGTAIGNFAITPVPGLSRGLQLHTFDLDGGTLLGMGVAKAGEGTFAIVGGTGRYEGASGSYAVRLSRDAGSRRASADFTFNLAGE
jgi:hypothetical protein